MDHYELIFSNVNNNNTMDSDDIVNKIDLKRKLVEATDAVRKKFMILKERNADNKQYLEKMYEPITEPLKKMASQPPLQQLKTPKEDNLTNQMVEKEDIDEFQSVVSESEDASSQDSMEVTMRAQQSKLRTELEFYLNKVESQKSDCDYVYGVTFNPNTHKYTMGNCEVRFTNEGEITVWRNNIQIGKFEGSMELFPILFLRLPMGALQYGMTDNTREIYYRILELTQAPYREYDRRMGYNMKSWRKYREIIERLMKEMHQTKLRPSLGKKQGGSIHLPTEKLLTNNSIDYVYWNKPKELVTRLRLLWGSKMAGNTGVDNEIQAIIEELREEGIIY